jgi:hypothetical protein
LVEQDFAAVTAFRRTEQGFVSESYSDRTQVIPLPEIGTDIGLADVYEGVEIVPEPEDEVA